MHSGGKVQLLSPTNASKVSALSFDGATNAWQGQLDIKDSSLIVQTTAATRQSVFATILNQIRMGRNSGAMRWFGEGIASSAASRDGSRSTALGAILNDNGSGGALYTTFFGQAVDINSILIRYTFNGDLDLDGGIDADDYARMDAGFAQKLTGWGHGDLDYSGVINADDFFLIDHAFAAQTPLPAPLAFGATSVPEPMFVAFAVLALLTPRSWQRRLARGSRSHKRAESSPASTA